MYGEEDPFLNEYNRLLEYFELNESNERIWEVFKIKKEKGSEAAIAHMKCKNEFLHFRDKLIKVNPSRARELTMMRHNGTPEKDVIALMRAELKDDTPFEETPGEAKLQIRSMFVSKPANTWLQDAAQRPAPSQLYGELWFEGEVCILFADTNVGKSILAVQIADEISKGVFSIMDGKVRSKVLYLDFELSDKQFESRYSENFSNHYRFDEHFYRVEIDPDFDFPEGVDFEDYLLSSLEREIVATGAKIVIVDNLTYLKNETDKASKATPLMRELKALKNKHNLSILVLAHTPKRDISKPLSRNDLQGSRMLLAFADSCFAIGESVKDKSIRYLKQIKVRNCEHIYDSENVVVCQIEKQCNNLRFDRIGFSHEREHLKEQSDKERSKIEQEVIELHEKGMSFREIGTQLNISHMKAKRIIDKKSVTDEV